MDRTKIVSIIVFVIAFAAALVIADRLESERRTAPVQKGVAHVKRT